MHATSNRESMDTKGHIKAAAAHLEEGGRRIKRDAADTADRVQGDLHSIAHNVGEQVREYIETAGEGLVHAKDSIADAGGSVVSRVRDNPMSAAAIALGVGVLLGAFLRRH